MSPAQLTNSILQNELGFEKAKIGMLPTVYTLGNGECIPYFIPDIRTRSGKTQIMGTVGIIVRDFEEEWATLLLSILGGNQIDDRFTFSCYITNIRSFINPPAFFLSSPDGNAISEFYSWLGLIREYTSGLPTSIYDLECALRSGDLNGVEFRKFYGHSVKIKAFCLWSAKRNILHSLKLFSFPDPLKRLSPYEKLYSQSMSMISGS
jgi:hypothetical protein